MSAEDAKPAEEGQVPVETRPITHQEPPVSATIKLFSANGADIMVTVRSGATAEDACTVLDTLVDMVKYGQKKYHLDTNRNVMRADEPAVVAGGPSVPAPAASAPAASSPAPAQPAPQPAPQATSAPGITDMTFQTEQLVSEIKEGKRYWKIKGAPFMKYGVRVWDEVLEAAGFVLEQMDQPVYSLTGYTAHYVEREPGKPLKVTMLVVNS